MGQTTNNSFVGIKIAYIANGVGDYANAPSGQYFIDGDINSEPLFKKQDGTWITHSQLSNAASITSVVPTIQTVLPAASNGFNLDFDKTVTRITGATQTITPTTSSGTMVDGQMKILDFTDNGTTRNIDFSSLTNIDWAGFTVVTATIPNKKLTIILRGDTTANKYFVENVSYYQLGTAIGSFPTSMVNQTASLVIPDASKLGVNVTGATSTVLVNAGTGTYKDGQPILITIGDNGTAQNITFASFYIFHDTTKVPTQTTPTYKTVLLGVYSENLNGIIVNYVQTQGVVPDIPMNTKLTVKSKIDMSTNPTTLQDGNYIAKTVSGAHANWGTVGSQASIGDIVNKTGTTYTFVQKVSQITQNADFFVFLESEGQINYYVKGNVNDWVSTAYSQSAFPNTMVSQTSSTVIPSSSYLGINVTSASATIQVNTGVGSYREGQPIIITMSDNGTARTITFSSFYVFHDVSKVPTKTTPGSKTIMYGVYNADLNSVLVTYVQTQGIVPDLPINTQFHVVSKIDMTTNPVTLADGNFILKTIGSPHANWGSIGTLVAVGDVVNKLGTTYSIKQKVSLITQSADFFVFLESEKQLNYWVKGTVNDWVSTAYAQTLSKVLVVDPIKGVDAVGNGSFSHPLQSPQYAHDLCDNSGWMVLAARGTHNIPSTFLITKLNFCVVGMGSVLGSTFFPNTTNVNSASSAVGLEGIMFANVVHSGACSLSLPRSIVTTSFTKTGGGYFNSADTNMQTATISITGAGTCYITQGFQGNISVASPFTINNAAAIVSIISSGGAWVPKVTAGVLFIQGGTVYNNPSNAFALYTSAGTLLALMGVQFADYATGAPKKISNASTSWTISGCTLDLAASTIPTTGDSVGTTMFSNIYASSGITSKGTVTTKAISATWVQANSYATGEAVIKDGAWYQANGTITAGTAFVVGTTGATWKSLSGSGGGSSGSTPKTPVAAVLNANLNPQNDLVNGIYFNDGDEVALFNVDSINAYYVLAANQTLVEPCILTYNQPNNNWSVTLDLTTVAQADGDFELWDKYRRSTWVLDKSYGQLNELKDNGSTRLNMTGKFMAGAGFYSTYDVNNQIIYKQISAGQTTNVGNPALFGIDSNGIRAKSAIDGSRLVSFYWDSNTLSYQVSNSLTNISYGTAVQVSAACYDFRAVEIPTGGFITVEAYGINTPSVVRELRIKYFLWTGAAYVQQGSTITWDSGTTAVSIEDAICLANNMVEICYTLGATSKRGTVRANVDGTTTVTAATTNSLGCVKLLKSGTSNKFVMLYRVASVLTAKMMVRNTDGTTTGSGTNTVAFTLGNNNQDRVNYDAKGGIILMTWTMNNASYCRWLDVSGNDLTATSENLIYNGDSYILPTMGADANSGVAMVKFNDSLLPQSVGWTKNAASILFSFPSLEMGDRNNFDYSSTAINSLLFTGSSYIFTFTGTAAGINPQLRPESGIVSYTTTTDIIPEGILQSSGNNEIAYVSWDGEESRVHSGLVPNVSYYFYFGTLTTTITNFYAGEAQSATSLRLDIQDQTLINNHTIALAEQGSLLSLHTSQIAAIQGSTSDTYAFPDYTIGFGTWFFRGEGGALPMPYAGGSNDSNRWFGQANEGRVSQYPYFTNGKNIKIVSWEQAQSNGRNAIMIGRDANGKGYLFMAGNNNSWGQWANTSLTSDANRNGKFILIDNSEIYGATKSIFSAFIPLDKWGNDSNRDTIVCCVYDSATGVYTNYAWGFASENSGDTWRIYPSGVFYSTVPQVIGTGKLISCDLGVYGAYYSIYESESVPGRLYYCGFYTSGTYYTGTASTLNTSALTQCLYTNNSPIIDCKEIQTMREGTIGAQMQIMKRYNNETYACGYNVYGVLGTGNAVNTDKFTRTAIPSPSNNLVSKFKLNKRVSFFLDTLGNLFAAGTNYDFVKTANTPVFTKGVVTSTTINSSGTQTINETNGTPTIIASNIENFWTRSQQTAGNSLLIYKDAITKKCFINGYVQNINGIDDLSTWGNFANYKRQLIYGDDVNNSDWEFIDFMFNGQITDANEYYVSLTAIIKNNVSGKTKLVRTGYFHTLTGITGDFESSILMRRWIDVSF